MEWSQRGSRRIQSQHNCPTHLYKLLLQLRLRHPLNQFQLNLKSPSTPTPLHPPGSHIPLQRLNPLALPPH